MLVLKTNGGQRPRGRRQRLEVGGPKRTGPLPDAGGIGPGDTWIPPQETAPTLLDFRRENKPLILWCFIAAAKETKTKSS